MKSITKINKIGFEYILLAVAVTAIMVFAVLPQFPQVTSTFDALSTKATAALAFGDSGTGGCCGGEGSGGGGEGSNTSDDFEEKPPARCDFLKAGKTSVPYGGANVTLTWGTSYAESVFINQGIGLVPRDGSKTVFVDETTTFTLAARDSEVKDTCAVKIVVEPPPKLPGKCDFLKANKTSVPYGGANVTLSWGTTNADNVWINQGIGTVADDGSRTVFVNSTRTYTLTAEGEGGDDSCAVKIVVEPKTEVPAPRCDFLKVSDSHVEEGDEVTLSWGTTNANHASINQGVGRIADDGSRKVRVFDDITYTLTVSNGGKQDTCTVHVEVEEEEDDEPAPRCDFLKVSDSHVEEGDEVTLSWGTTNADDVTINQGIGDVADDGSRDVRVHDDTTFVLTARNGNEEDTCTIHVEVEEEEDDEPAPRCELEISDRTVKKGEEVTLEWDVRNAEEITIEDDRGDVIYRDRNPSTRDRGDIEVEITRDTEFTLNAEGEDDDRECDVEVEVDEDEVLVLTERDQKPIVAGISLTQVPYTGFEAGPMLTFLFYALLTVWAFVVAYVLVIRKGSVLGYSLAGTSTFHNEVPEESYEETVTENKAVVHSTAAPTADAPLHIPSYTPVIGYSAYATDTETEEAVPEETNELAELENYANDRQILFSSDALRFFHAHYAHTNVYAALDKLIAEAKGTFPSEGGWVVLNLTRVEQLMSAGNETENVTVTDSAAPAGSLAEAIVKGNVSAAYRMIEHRPMIALADAATELDAAYRARQNGIMINESSSPLYTELSKHSTEQLKNAIDALTGALDGTYSDEESAVKIAIMKAVKIFA